MQVKFMSKMALILLLSSSVSAQASLICDWDAFGKGILGLVTFKKAVRDYHKDHAPKSKTGEADQAVEAALFCTSCPATNRMLSMGGDLLDVAAMTVLAFTAYKHLKSACLPAVN